MVEAAISWLGYGGALAVVAGGMWTVDVAAAAKKAKAVVAAAEEVEEALSAVEKVEKVEKAGFQDSPHFYVNAQRKTTNSRRPM